MHVCGAALLVHGGDGKGTVKRKKEGGVRKGGREKERGDRKRERAAEDKRAGRGSQLRIFNIGTL